MCSPLGQTFSMTCINSTPIILEANMNLFHSSSVIVLQAFCIKVIIFCSGGLKGINVRKLKCSLHRTTSHDTSVNVYC